MRTRVLIALAVSAALVARTFLVVSLSTSGRHQNASGLVTVDVTRVCIQVTC